MLHFIRASRFRVKGHGSKSAFLKQTTLSLQTTDRIAILAHDPKTIDGLTRIFCGALRLDGGSISRDVTFSPPIGGLSNVSPALTGLEGAKFAARLYGVDEQRLFAAVQSLTEAGDAIYQRIQDMPPPVRLMYNHALWLCIRFNCYFFSQNVIPGSDKGYKFRCLNILNHAMQQTGFIVFTKNARVALEYCDYGLVYDEGTLIPFTQIDQAVEFFNQTS